MKVLKKEKKRIIKQFMPNISQHKQEKKVGDILKALGFDKIGNGKSDLSINHDNILYK